MALGLPCYTKREMPPDEPEYNCMAFTVNLISMFYPVPGLYYSYWFLIPVVWMLANVYVGLKVPRGK